MGDQNHTTHTVLWNTVKTNGKNGWMGGTNGEAMKGGFDENTLHADMKFSNTKFLLKNPDIKLFTISNVHWLYYKVLS